MPYLAPVASEDRALPVVALDHANGQREVMDGINPVTFGPFPPDETNRCLVLIQNYGDANELGDIAWVRGDGSATTGDDATSLAVYPQVDRVEYIAHTGRTLSVLGRSGLVVKIIPYLVAP